MKSVPSSLSSDCPTCQGTQGWSPGPTPGDLSPLGTASSTGMKADARSGRDPGGPGVPDTSDQVLGMGQPSLTGAFGAGVLSALLVQMSILAEHREISGLGLQSSFSSSKSPCSIFSPLGEGTKVTLPFGFRGSHKQF